ncbi:DsbA family protein [Anaeromyxobacter dehalogenans]|uniref:DsbA oxidoreductase n=1 Tax=Anaeromyxobacter dehalogenans (strain 2CP-C) TaxID=290397 RepID=Q2IGV3_ANADE|nr:thioredoxin [Anaeromyxobacter dehalogenans]ABC83813.1 DsbA oxidoreductase [Anaeromyxobacter dehalogenans 2CP-C]
MKHVSWVVALVIGFAIGFVGRGSWDMGGRPSRAPAGAPTRARPVEDPKAVYRVPADDSPVRGPADALVTIVESSDFQCPYCKRGAATMKQVEDAYRGKVRFVFKHNPLSFHPQAMPAALAAEEARAQGGDEKFWALHDKLFDSAPALDQAAIEKAAGELGLDVAKVREAMQSGTHRARIERDQKLVVGLGAPATPTFFVNGRKIAGAQPIEAFRTVIDEELRKAEQLVRSGTPAAQVYAKTIERGATAPVFLPGTVPPPAAAAPSAAAPAPAAPAAPPPATYAKVPLRADDPARGPADAKLTVVLFSDFQCPFCSRVEPTLKQLEEAYPGQVRIVWKHQPLSFHPNALPAAIAAEAARDQGKFWPMHEKLFANQQALSPATYEQYAKELGLDLRKFQAAVAARKGADRIAADQQLANGVGANGTPTMFFNCRQVVGALPLERMRPIVEEELKKADALLKGGKAGPGFYEQACQANLALKPAAPQQGAVIPAALPAGQPVQGLAVRADDPTRGNPKAPVTIVLFSDFQCPFCARVEPTLAQVQKTYGDKVRVVWKHQPLGMHPNAMPAAEAAEAAREQGKFWQMHEKLFASQRELSDALYERAAREIGLDVARFDAARRSGRGRARIAEDQALAARIGAQATPTMFVNGVKVEGAVPFEQIRAVVDAELARR